MTLARVKPPTALAKPQPSRERILNYGKEGSSKTHSWLSIAEAYPESPFYVIDTDDSVQRMLETDYKDLSNLNVVVAQGWESFTEWCDRFSAMAFSHVNTFKPKRKEDYPWIVVDFSDATWDMVQAYFTEQVFKKGIDDYFLQTRTRIAQSSDPNSKASAFEGWTDWPVINKIFQSTWNPLTKSGGQYHLYITAGSKAVSGGQENKMLYNDLKAMPTGEKRMPHRVHSVLMSSVDRNGWYLSSAKDRGRELLFQKKMISFAISYLNKVAGWQL